VVNDMNYDVSIFCSGNRPELWDRLYKSCQSNRLSWELIICGNQRPTFDAPSNFRFIYSSTKPSQCAEIALGACSGEFVSMVQDDYILSNGFFDILLNDYIDRKNEKNIFCGKMKRKGSLFNDIYASEIPDSPLLGYIGLMKHSFITHIGGVEREFIGTYWDMDILMRVLEDDGNIVMNNKVFVDEWHPGKRRKKSSLTRRLSCDVKFYRSLWVVSPEKVKSHKGEIYCKDATWGALSKKRLIPFTPFKEEKILTYNQGKTNKDFRN